jgi:hypothetical protein
MRSDPKTRALETCLTQVQSGVSLDEVLAPYPEWAEEMRPILEATQAARWIGASIKVPPEVQERSREVFLTSAERMYATRRRPLILPRLRLGLVPFALLLVILLGAASSVAVSAQALPGEMLYPLKIITEQAQLILAPSASLRLKLEQGFERERVVEIQKLIQHSRSAEVNFVGELNQMQPGVWSVGGFQVLVPPEAQIIGQIKPGYAIEVQGILQPDGAVLAHKLRAYEFEITGTLQRINGNQFTVNGVVVIVTSDTVVQGGPVLNSRVLIRAFSQPDGSLWARLLQVITLQSGKDPGKESNQPTTGQIQTQPAVHPLESKEPPKTGIPAITTEPDELHPSTQRPALL